MLASLGVLFERALGLITAPGVPTGSASAASPLLKPTGTDLLGIGPSVAGPLLTGAEYLIPAGVALAGLHKLMQHQESGGSFLVDMLVKGGGAVLIIQLVKGLSGLPG